MPNALGLVRILAQDIAHAVGLGLADFFGEQLELERFLRQQKTDLGIGQRRDVKVSRLIQFLLADLLDHAAVANEDHLGDGELLGENVDLSGYGGGIGSVAGKDANGQWFSR